MPLCLSVLMRFLLVHVFDVSLEIALGGNLLPALFTGEGLLFMVFDVPQHIVLCSKLFRACWALEAARSLKMVNILYVPGEMRFSLKFHRA